MSIQSAPYYWLKCDACGTSSTADSEFAAWASEDTAMDNACDDDWSFNADRTTHHCQNCPRLACGECDKDFEAEGPRKQDDDEIDMCVECASDGG